MLRRIWQWLKQLFRRLGKSTPPQSANSPNTPHQASQTTGRQPQLPTVNGDARGSQPLDNAEYENIFMQILDGVEQGWSCGNIKGFLIAKNVKESALVEWLREFGKKLLEIPEPNQELVRRMLGLGKLRCGELSQVADEIVSQILIPPKAKVSENDGADAVNKNEGDYQVTEAEYWFEQGKQQFDAGDFEGALASYDQAVHIKPDYYKAWHNRGFALDNLERFEGALASYDQAVHIKSDFYNAWHNRGVVLANLERFEDAIASFDQAVHIKPDFYNAWMELGAVLVNLERFEEALASFDQAVDIKPDDHHAWLNRGSALFTLEQFEEALASFDQVVDIKPDDYQAWYSRGMTLFRLERFEEALASFDQVVDIKPDEHHAWYSRGIALDNLERFEKAIESFDQAVDIKPDDYQAWVGRGIAAFNSVACNYLLASRSTIAKQNSDLNQRGYPGAFASYQEGLKHCHQHTHPEGWGELHHAIGEAHYFRGNQDQNPRSYYRKAVTEYNLALETLTEDDFPELHLEVLQDLIKAYLGLGRTGKAQELKRRGTDLLQSENLKRSNWSKKS
ncbi:Tetratricopeptide TPR_1 repeat-containing protein [Crinalium epipsammum PCC 9333]|uniref:Tetratricopeptide TPR_1 repeat-containing protein n=1 Tax=Crinalium epipsammum PCC 9333 TaxID=1173022 RepID=K9W4Y5_9CYAN|nr:tetratricopeptide repeat protein [Crinalium epipsammum]AFZ15256.1 Tetratricopeptide TPR_1 repeat-containing protein [Crinalium epipsammum PCC 9333]